MAERVSLAGKRICLLHPYAGPALLRRLKDEGLTVVLVGGSAPSDLVEAVVDVPLYDHRAVERAVLEQHARRPFDVVLPVYEGGTALTAHLAKMLGLPGENVSAAEASRNKFETYLHLSRAGLATPDTIAVTPSPEEVGRIESAIGYPAIIKLADSMNSQGVTCVRNADECRRALHELGQLLERPKDFDASLDRNRIAYGGRDVRLVAQRFCPGKEVNVDVLFNASSAVTLGVFEKAQSAGPYFPEHFSVSPTSLDAAETRAVEELACAGVRALGLSLGAAHVEIRFSEAGPCILEIGARPGGGLTVEAIERRTGINPVVELARLLLGGDLPRLGAEAPAVLYGGKVYTESGRLVAIRGVHEAQRLPNVRKFVQLHREGDLVHTMPESAQPHFCYYLIDGSSRDEVLGKHAAITSLIELDIEPVARAVASAS